MIFCTRFLKRMKGSGKVSSAGAWVAAYLRFCGKMVAHVSWHGLEKGDCEDE